MKISAKTIRLALLSVILGVAVLGSVQPASAFSFNPIKAIKSVAKAAVSTVAKAGSTVVKAAVAVGKETVKVTKVAVNLSATVYSKAFKVGTQLSLSAGRGLLTGSTLLGSNILKIATAKDPLKAMAKVAVLGTPLAPFVVAKQTFDSVKNPPRMKDFVPAPPTIGGLAKGISTASLSSSKSVFAPKPSVFASRSVFAPRSTVTGISAIGRPLGEPRRTIDELKLKMEDPKRKLVEELKVKMEDPKRKLGEESKVKMEDPKRKLGEESKVKMEDPKRKLGEESKVKMEDPKRKMDEPKRMMTEPKTMMGAQKSMMAPPPPKPMMPPPPPPMMSGAGGYKH